MDGPFGRAVLGAGRLALGDGRSDFLSVLGARRWEL